MGNMDYFAWSICYDMLNTPLNIDIKRVIKHNLKNDIQIPKVFIIRILKQKDVFPSLYNDILNEKEVNWSYIEMPHSAIWSHSSNFPLGTFDILSKWSKIYKHNKIKINKFIFITSNYMNSISDIKNNILLITEPEKINDYCIYKNVVSVNYNKYLINDETLLRKKIKKYDKHNWHNIGTGNSIINKRVFFQLNMFVEALNKEKSAFTCNKFLVNWDEKQSKYITQYILFFD